MSDKKDFNLTALIIGVGGVLMSLSFVLLAVFAVQWLVASIVDAVYLYINSR